MKNRSNRDRLSIKRRHNSEGSNVKISKDDRSAEMLENDFSFDLSQTDIPHDEKRLMKLERKKKERMISDVRREQRFKKELGIF
jgi:hypothetical protein